MTTIVTADSPIRYHDGRGRPTKYNNFYEALERAVPGERVAIPVSDYKQGLSVRCNIYRMRERFGTIQTSISRAEDGLLYFSARKI